MTLPITLDYIPRVLLCWTLCLHGGGEWDGGVAGGQESLDGAILDVVTAWWRYLALLTTLDLMPQVLLYWTLRSHGGGEWDGGVAGDGRAFQLVPLARSL